MPQNLWNDAKYRTLSDLEGSGCRYMLNHDVTSDFLVEAMTFLAGPRTAKTTGGVLTVHGGNPTAYAR